MVDKRCSHSGMYLKCAFAAYDDVILRCCFGKIDSTIVKGLSAEKYDKIPEIKDIIIFGASASVFEKDKEQVKLVGCDDFLTKPVNYGLLLDMLDKYLPLEWVYAEQAADETIVITTAIETEYETIEQTLVPPPKGITATRSAEHQSSNSLTCCSLSG